jgi:intraflagellar transport protein 80
MRLKTKQLPSVHTDLAGACGWSVWNELFSGSDDQTIHKWNMAGEPEGKVGLCATHTALSDCCDRALIIRCAGVPTGRLLHRPSLVSSELKEEPGWRDGCLCRGVHQWCAFAHVTTTLACTADPQLSSKAVVSQPAGTFKIVSRTGRLEKSVDAHTGACIALRWSYDGEQDARRSGINLGTFDRR